MTNGCRTRRATAAVAVAVAACGAALAAPAQAQAATGQPSVAARACDRAAWQSRVQGAPTGFKAGSPSGDYLWHDKRGFHLRVTHAHHDQRVYTGVITSSAPMRVQRVKLEKGDSVKVAANHRSLAFAFADHGYVDGINFHTDCAASLTVSRLHVGNRTEGRRQVFLGRTKAHPAKVPFTVHRRAKPKPAAATASA